MYPKNISAHKSTQSHNVEDCSLKRYSWMLKWYS
jgi:hypothetical protein